LVLAALVRFQVLAQATLEVIHHLVLTQLHQLAEVEVVLVMVQRVLLAVQAEVEAVMVRVVLALVERLPLVKAMLVVQVLLQVVEILQAVVVEQEQLVEQQQAHQLVLAVMGVLV
jgi:hypothetical protein